MLELECASNLVDLVRNTRDKASVHMAFKLTRVKISEMCIVR